MNRKVLNSAFSLPTSALRGIQRAERLLKVITGAKTEKSVDEPPAWQIEKTNLQALVCHILLVPFCTVLLVLMKYFRGYTIENMAEIRAEFRRIWEEKERDKTPLIICANHLTFIDSALIIWALASNWWYLFNYNAFTWNLPAGDFFKKKLHYHLTLYLTKCIFLDRKGSSAHKNEVLNLCRYLLEKGNVVLIFPEGQRSRTGVFDEEHLRFGVGKIAASLEKARVLCIYLRSDLQETYSNYPPKNSRFDLQMKLIEPIASDLPKKQASVEIVRQIGATIKAMENKYFAEKREE